ncbi:GntR family transcriptional regulator [Nocardia rhizosphaerihabitans]|uniref:GntR-family transcriptional regulator n=1 Tax=Nocardia rhizosphaerihabitans TaxID=1691570 RepID=A0ABQ2KTJ7_9NOCA|nr:GntR family transcriptional regulator [Nocardia rhizosphaerihabitans]GGN92884.1 putative GntR-family transcriptional regulator [Nocardia rhizosphaerihabitans]
MTATPSSSARPRPPDPGTGRRSAPARRIRDILRARIRSGVYGNRPLPAEAQLAADFATSRNIVRDALTLLRDEGLIDRVPGAGTFVVADKAVQGLDRLRGLAETFETRSDRVVNRVLLAEVVPATPLVAERLELEPGDPVVALERVRYLDGAPLSLDASYLTADVGIPLLDKDLTGCDVFGLLEAELGLPLGSAAVAIEAVATDPTVAGLLEVRAGSPLLFLERLTYTDSGRPVDLEYIRYRGDRFSLSGRLDRVPVTPRRTVARDTNERG